MKDMKKLMGMKDEGPDDDMKKHAKLKVLHELRGMASKMMGDDVANGMSKKVTVAADNKADLAKGLDKAKELVSQKQDNEYEHTNEDDSPEDDHIQAEEPDEDDQHEALENDGMDEHTPESIDAAIAHLTDMKRKMQMKR